MDQRIKQIADYNGRNYFKGGKKMNETCQTCKWYAEYEGVCTNGKSEYCADFTDTDDYCGLWEGN